MESNIYDEIVREGLLWLAVQYPYFVLYNSVVMFNHIHAILEMGTVGTGCELSVLFGVFETTSSKIIHQAEFLDFA